MSNSEDYLNSHRRLYVSQVQFTLGPTTDCIVTPPPELPPCKRFAKPELNNAGVDSNSTTLSACFLAMLRCSLAPRGRGTGGYRSLYSDGLGLHGPEFYSRYG
jgi:hypothetical protein